MDNLILVVLPIILYLLLIMFVVTLIVLALKLIKLVAKFDNLVEDVTYKVNKLNGFFDIVDYATDSLISFNDKIIKLISTSIASFFKGKKRRRKNE